ncbi:MOSC domain-containing protein [Endozoicomonas euniceicola]|uniref:MOSC domain-containing protein n=1 Tax=Endozoicomonas euniceicola TaxID=1234143 RepID=A0ABY6GPG4_9GAMM|nr:MOSC domain-containing protein [Endozoicomonas euniceicola]UYM14643.1 MOSC domain-containing protein [Endozoicomonas euniceicola]
MKLLSVSTGKVRSLDIDGQRVKTAFLKEAVSGPVRVELNGIEGNEVAVHTDAIYAIAQEHYGYWAEKLGADSKSWPVGYLGENLTVSGLDEAALQVGDKVSIGKSVVLTVTGPRIPCFKLCWRMAQPLSFIREFALSGRSGVYFDVDCPGIILAGDDVRVVQKAKNSVGINRISKIAFSAVQADEHELRHILSMSCLSETSALSLRNILYQFLDGKRIKEDRWKGWRKLTVESVREETKHIKSFFLKASEEHPLAPYRAGQFLTVRLPVNKEERPITRVWSLSDYQEKPDRYRLSIKKEPFGVGSGYMHECIKPGSELEIQAPQGRFVLDRGGFKPVLFIAAGIGITPLFSMLKAHLARGEKAPPVYFIHCCKSRAEQPLRQELDALSQAYSFSTLYIFDQPDSEDVQGIDYDIKGFLNAEAIKTLIQGCHILHGGKRIDMPLVEFDIYMCGPPVFQEKIREGLIAEGANEDRLFQESFTPKALENNEASLEKATVVFSRSNITSEWLSEDGLSLLELAESAGLSPDYGCRVGICQSCMANLVEGKVRYDVALMHELEAGKVLLCSAKPAEDRVVIDL